MDFLKGSITFSLSLQASPIAPNGSDTFGGNFFLIHGRFFLRQNDCRRKKSLSGCIVILFWAFRNGNKYNDKTSHVCPSLTAFVIKRSCILFIDFILTCGHRNIVYFYACGTQMHRRRRKLDCWCSLYNTSLTTTLHGTHSTSIILPKKNGKASKYKESIFGSVRVPF